MRKILFISAALFALNSPAHAEVGIVIGCHDGDTCTVRIGDQAIKARLAGIDAPEMKSGRKWPTQPYADEARAALTAMIGNQPVDVECTGQQSYNRPVCRFYACEDPYVLPAHPEHDASFCPPGDAAFDVQRRLVDQGDAWSAIQYEPARDRDPTIPGLEASARAAHQGLWAQPYPVNPGAWRHR